MATEDKKEDLEFHEQEDGTLVVSGLPDVEGEEKPEQKAEKTEDADEEDESEGQETSAEEASNEDADGEDERPNNKTEENRRRRQEKKQLIRERNERLRSELAARDAELEELRQRVARQEQRTSGTEMVALDNEIKKSADAYAYFKEQLAQAVESKVEGSGRIAAEAAEKMQQAAARYNELNQVKKSYSERQNAPTPADPTVLHYGKQFIERNSWYDPNGRGEDSRIALAIDQSMTEEGWNPRTPEYWAELQRRVDKKLPHRAQKGYNADKRSPKPVVTGSGREGKSGGGRVAGFTLSKERVQAMRDAGIYDDPVKRAKQIEAFRRYDLEQQRNAA